MNSPSSISLTQNSHCVRRQRVGLDKYVFKRWKLMVGEMGKEELGGKKRRQY